MRTQKILLLSIRPKFAEKIFSGEKTIELRRIPPKVEMNDLVVVYVSSPVKAIWGIFVVECIEESDLVTFWEKNKARTGVSETEYLNYFEGTEKVYGIKLKDPLLSDHPIPLNEIRRDSPGFHPPQLYRYLNKEDQLLSPLKPLLKKSSLRQYQA